MLSLYSKTTGRLAICLGLVTLAACCSSIPRIPARGSVAGYEFVGTVDSQAARDYLEGSPPVDLDLLRRGMSASGWVPCTADLRAISERYSPDVATLLFVEAIAGNPANARARAIYLEELGRERHAGRQDDVGWGDLLVLFAPGWLYESHGAHTGADLKLERECLDSLGIANELIPLGENDTVEANAAVVADAIRRRSTTGVRIVLVSASKSSAEVALALGDILDVRETQSVLAWLSVGGLIRGTPLADRALEPGLACLVWLRLGLQGFGLGALRSMQVEPRTRAVADLSLPQHLLVLSYVGVPLSGHVSDRGLPGYEYLRSWGPNDGLTLLADELVPTGYVLCEPGADHYFGLAGREERATALFRTLLRLAAKDSEG